MALLISDTVTKPTPSMLEAMTNAEVGDDVFGRDPTVNALQEKAAALFGMEASLFCASGTMTNQIAINLHTRPGEEVICHQYAHIHLYEGGGIALNSGASTKLVGEPGGQMTASDVKAAINPDDVHQPRSALVAMENTSNKGGGSCADFTELEAIGQIARDHNMGYHLDGARLFNALVARNETPLQYGRLFDSISICLSKGLGCPVGSLLLGSKEFIREARRVRKRFGGGWRQAGFLAAAGIYALDHHVARMADDHRRAKALGDHLANQPYIAHVNPVETNIVIFRLADNVDAQVFTSALMKDDIAITDMGSGLLRMVTHLDITDHDIDETCSALSKLNL